MYDGKRIIEVAALAAVISLGTIILATALPCGALAAQQAAAASPKVHELLTSLAQEWLEEQGVVKPAASPPQKADQSLADYVNSSAGAIHDQIVALASAVPNLA